MATKLGRFVTYFEGLLTIKSYDALIIFARSHDSWQALYLRYQLLIEIEPDWMMIYFNGLLRIKSHDSLVTWSCKIT